MLATLSCIQHLSVLSRLTCIYRMCHMQSCDTSLTVVIEAVFQYANSDHHINICTDIEFTSGIVKLCRPTSETVGANSVTLSLLISA